MKLSPIIAFFYAGIFCFCVMAAMPRKHVGWLSLAYVGATVGFVFIGLSGLVNGVKAEDKSYLRYYWVFLVGTQILAASMALVFNLSHSFKNGTILLVATLVQALALAYVAADYLAKPYAGKLPRALTLVLLQGVCMLISGTTTLASLMVQQAPTQFILRVGLGSYWLAVGALSFCFAFGIVRNTAVWYSLNSVAPAVLGIVAFSYIGISFTGQQKELTRQHSSQSAAHVELEVSQ